WEVATGKELCKFPGHSQGVLCLAFSPDGRHVAEVAEECRRLLARLGDAGLEAVAVWKMEGYSNEKNAPRLRCGPRTVERKLRLIRDVWEKLHFARFPHPSGCETSGKSKTQGDNGLFRAADEWSGNQNHADFPWKTANPGLRKSRNVQEKES